MFMSFFVPLVMQDIMAELTELGCSTTKASHGTLPVAFVSEPEVFVGRRQHGSFQNQGRLI